jgi:PhnB protein
MKISPYLVFDGHCEAAFELYARALGGAITFKQTHGESPMAAQVGPDWQNKIMHITLSVGDHVIMGSDAPPDHYQKPRGVHVSISVNDAREGERVFEALAEGGTVSQPFQKTFWSPGFGMLVDRFGTPWMVNSEGPA